MLVRLHAAPLVLPLFLSGLASCDLGIDVDSLSAGCVGVCDGGADGVADGAPGSDDSPSSADSGAPADAAAAADAGNGCPSGGGEMVRVRAGDASTCVDRVEVTNASFAAFLDAGANIAAPAGCDPGASPAPAGWPPAAGHERSPVTSVTWCAAKAYCTWAGKRLCGAVGGGALDPSLLGRAAFDEWFAVCSSGGTSIYPYADAYAPTACNGNDYGAAAPLPVGSLATCAAPGANEPLDLSGNVWEWTDACDSQGNCFARGGAFNSPAHELACSSVVASLRSVSNGTIGLRCCAP